MLYDSKDNKTKKMCKLYKIFFQKVGENNNKKITNKFSEIEEKIIKQNYERKKTKFFMSFVIYKIESIQLLFNIFFLINSVGHFHCCYSLLPKQIHLVYLQATLQFQHLLLHQKYF